MQGVVALLVDDLKLFDSRVHEHFDVMGVNDVARPEEFPVVQVNVVVCVAVVQSFPGLVVKFDQFALVESRDYFLS